MITNKNEKIFAKYGNPGEKYGYPVFIDIGRAAEKTAARHFCSGHRRNHHVRTASADQDVHQFRRLVLDLFLAFGLQRLQNLADLLAKQLFKLSHRNFRVGGMFAIRHFYARSENGRDIEHVGFGAVLGVQRQCHAEPLDQLEHGAFLVIDEADMHGSSRTLSNACRCNPFFNPREATDALVGFIDLSIKVWFGIWAGLDTCLSPFALLLMDHHQAVLLALVYRFIRAGFKTCRLGAVVAHPRHIEKGVVGIFARSLILIPIGSRPRRRTRSRSFLFPFEKPTGVVEFEGNAIIDHRRNLPFLQDSILVSTALALPVSWIPQTWGGFDIPPIHVVLSRSTSPKSLACDSACLAANALIQVGNICQLAFRRLRHI